MEAVDLIDTQPLGQPTWTKILVRLMLMYLVVGFLCWEELRYRAYAVAVPATVMWEKAVPKEKLMVRYEFQVPETGERRHKTVTIRHAQRPSQRETTAQWIAGETPQSRLATQAKPFIIQVFYWSNILIGAAVLSVIAYAAWEYHHIPDRHLAPRDRGLARYQRRRQVEKAWRSGH